ncbi:MAG: tRNA (adenosine(37)-N6)-threonylcarbamoyltransferase complex ATPase subunit type 1 TsaE [Ruminococcaceae bacterium]|nr:tRNA (adenosine(37)-N6)-threonylcarbamoyltransferase complex ATPase subunit type 1 TsaE [Oscillospiraceae bacterium]
MSEFISKSPSDTEKIAENFAKTLKGGEVIAFKGGLGMGKTCFVRGLAKGLGFNGEVTSPTFAIVNEYLGGKFNLYHFDMYRIEGWDDLFSIGYFDYISDDSVLAVEWSENIENCLDNNTIYINIASSGENERIITIGK